MKYMSFCGRKMEIALQP